MTGDNWLRSLFTMMPVEENILKVGNNVPGFDKYFLARPATFRNNT